MKKTDIATVILIASIGTIGAFFACNALLGDPNDKSVTFTTISSISSQLDAPDSEIFNFDAINPTVEVYVGNCVDEDQDGVLNSAELVACNRIAPVDDEEEETETESENEETEEQE